MLLVNKQGQHIEWIESYVFFDICVGFAGSGVIFCQRW